MGTTISGDTGVVFPDATTQSTAVTVATPFSINASAGAGAQLRLPEATANGVNYVAVKAADALSSNVTFTLPTADGTNGQVLQTNGAGQLSFGSVSPGGTTGQVQINNSGAFGAISSGTSGQVLTSNGAGVAPSFAAAGGMTVIAAITPTTAQTYTYTNLAAYKQIVVFMSNVGIGSGGLSNGRVSLSSDNGSTYSAVIVFTNTSGSSLTGRLDIFNTNSSIANKPWTSFQSASSPTLGFDTTSGVVNAIRVESSNPLNSTGLIFVAGIL